MLDDRSDAPHAENRPADGKGIRPREVRLEDLLQGARELLIRHGEDVYHLRITRNGRLLLTK
jgi:hemin uptake protein HemP